MHQVGSALAPLSARLPPAENGCSPVGRVRVCPSAVQQFSRRWLFSSPSSLSPACTRRYRGAIKQKYANRHRAYQYIAESKRWESNDRQKVRFCYRFNLTKGTDIATTFSIVKPTLQVFSSNLSSLVSGYGGLRTFV